MSLPDVGPESGLRIAYWNALFTSDAHQQIDYIEALDAVVGFDVLLVDECKEGAAKLLSDRYPTDYPETPRQMYNDVPNSVAVVSKIAIEKPQRCSPWPRVKFKGPIAAPFYDGREVIRTVVPREELGPLSVYAAHITHPHYFWQPRLALRRPVEWDRHRITLKNDPNDFLWFADTNTVRASTVARRLGLASIGAELLEHEGGPTWGYQPLHTPPLLYLDRCAASRGVAATRLETVPRTLGGVVNPSDHAVILATVPNN